MQINKRFQIFINNCALGDTTGIASIDLSNEIIGANTMVSGLLENKKVKETIKINVKRLDEYIFEKGIQNISVIKIDVEGFEYLLIKGLTKYFKENYESLPVMIVEVTPSAYPLLKCNIEDLAKLTKKYNYSPYSTDGKSKIDLNTLKNTTDILFMQD